LAGNGPALRLGIGGLPPSYTAVVDDIPDAPDFAALRTEQRQTALDLAALQAQIPGGECDLGWGGSLMSYTAADEDPFGMPPE
jgi:hypothetical protein